KKPPKKINGFIGYRTSLSTKNKETWSFAHNYCGRLWIKVGAVLLILSIIAQLPFWKSDEDTINLVTIILEAIQLITILLSIVPVEKALKRSFDKNGNKKQ
ncbi:MAG: SdpI family protein, partial [Ruminococcus sp.]|nr:SdpI family protein [Candidatus Copronaster equi]